ncbi:MAG: death-on-curing protein [Saprospiraceae bacterium]
MDKGEIIIYRDDSGKAELQVHIVDQTVWLTQLQMSGLFERDKSVISRHIRNAIEEGEVEEEATVANFATVLG